MPPRSSAVCLMLAVCAAVAQTPPRMVTLNLIAIDGQGHAVADLAANDLQIADEGKPQSIATFRREAAAAPAAPAQVEFSNRLPGLAGVHVVLFDLLNLDLGDRKPATDRIVRALQQLEGGDAVYLYLITLDGKLVPVRGLPRNALDAPAPGAGWAREAAALLESAMGPVTAQRPVYERDVVLRIKTSYGILEALAGRLEPLSGRKNIVWITLGTPRTFSREHG